MSSIPASRDFALIGLSHKTAPVSVRERLAISPEELPDVLRELREQSGAEETMLVTTCNRVEAYLYGGPEAIDGVRGYFARRAGPDTNQALYLRTGPEAVAHLFRVASSLDSMVVGEPQILGQVKSAYGLASDLQLAGTITHRLFHAAFAVGKRVRTETGLGEGAVSVSYAAIELARKIFGDLSPLKVLILGAGEMAELTGVHLQAQGVKQITISSRTWKRLPKNIQQVFREQAAKTAEDYLAWVGDFETKAAEGMKSQGATFKPFPAAELKKWRSSAPDFLAQWEKDTAAATKDAATPKKVAARWRQLISQ